MKSLNDKRVHLLKLFIQRDKLDFDTNLLDVIKCLPEKEVDEDIMYLEEELKGQIY